MMDKISNNPVESERDVNIEEKLPASTSKDTMECRSCLAGVQKDACVDVFCAWNPPWPGMGLSMAEDMAKLAGIQISVSDPHSKIICKTCCNMLQNAISFMLSVQNSDFILRKRLKHSSTEESSWPKPIQVDKNIANDALQDMEMEIENIKQEVVSEDEFDNDACNDTPDTRFETFDIKIEPEEMTQQHIVIDNNLIIPPPEENQTSIPNGDAETHAESRELQDVKEEPLSDDEIEAAPDIEKDCMLCMKAFHTVRGLKAHVIAVHSYDCVRTPPKPPVNRMIECPICNRCFETRMQLYVHETCHSKFACYVCDKKFDSFHQLSTHRNKHCKKRSVLPRLKTLDDVRRPPQPTKIKKFNSSHLRNVLLHNINNVQSESAPEVPLDINNLSENIKTQHIINLIKVNSKIGKEETERNTDESNKVKFNTNGLELINEAQMEDNIEVPCPIEHLSSGIDSEISNKVIKIENNEQENNSDREIETDTSCIKMKKCTNYKNNCRDDEVANDNISEMEQERNIGYNHENVYKNEDPNYENDVKDNKVTNDKITEIPSITICIKESSELSKSEESKETVQLAEITSEISSIETLQSEINKTKDTLTHKLDCQTTPEQIVKNEKNDQNELHSKIHLECITEENLEIQLGAHSFGKENDMETDNKIKSL